MRSVNFKLFASLTIILSLLLSTAAYAQDTPSGDDVTEVPETHSILVWWPASLVSSQATMEIIQQQTQEFQSAEGNITVNFRTKLSGEDLGGIMSTLRTASLVAPGVLPDLTLIRRRDLVAAQQAGLIQPLESANSVSSAIVGDLDSALQLGQLNGSLYGVPYTINVQHLAYRPTPGTDYSSWRFDDVLERGEQILFPAARTTGVNDTFFLQYRAAGGTLPGNGSVEPDEQALISTLGFYEQARINEIFDESVLEYSGLSNYINFFNDGSVDIIHVNSSQYQSLHLTEENLRPAPIPTPAGDMITMLDGWIWVLVASNPDQQALAMRYLNWMMEIDSQGVFRQVAVTNAAGLLPSRTSALLQISDAEYANFILNLVSGVILPTAESDGGTLARVMQSALVNVLTEQQTAEQATADIMNQLGQ